MSLTLEQFAENLRQEVLVAAELEDHEDFVENAFTRRVLDYLADAGEIEDSEARYYHGTGAKLNGYVLNLADESLDLFVSVNAGALPPIRLEKARVDTAFRNLRSFLTKSMGGLYQKVEESHKAFSVIYEIYEVVKKQDLVSRVRLFLLTDSIVKVDRIPEPEEFEGLTLSYHVWDIERLYRWYTSGHERETIEIDFTKRQGESIQCIEASRTEAADYTTYLAVVPGRVLVDIYREFGPRLLERNVRSFLQVRGDVNKGIQQTLKEVPSRFLAYNNGITATAAKVVLETLPDGRRILREAMDLQIVNGGQTTASLFHGERKEGLDLSAVYVQMKLSVVHDPERLDEFVSQISRFANSQNKVNAADFSANDPFHRAIEAFSRDVWAPAAPGSQRQTRWFYERARGQFGDARSRAGTPAKMREFDAMHPRDQMFTKTDLAKFENTWMQRPHIVSRGAQKNFAEFTLELKKRGGFKPDEEYFERLIAKGILFREAESIVRKQNYGGYRANIVAYTLARLANATEQRIDLARIWKTQALTPALEDAIVRCSKTIKDAIINPPGNRNVTEWCKSEKCWEACLELELKLPVKVVQELISIGKQEPLKNSGIAGADEEDLQNISDVRSVPADTWFRLASWAKETGNLQGWQRGLSFGLGRLNSNGKDPSPKQAKQGAIILAEAKRLGFPVENVSK